MMGCVGGVFRGVLLSVINNVMVFTLHTLRACTYRIVHVVHAHHTPQVWGMVVAVWGMGGGGGGGGGGGVGGMVGGAWGMVVVALAKGVTLMETVEQEMHMGMVWGMGMVRHRRLPSL